MFAEISIFKPQVPQPQHKIVQAKWFGFVLRFHQCRTCLWIYLCVFAVAFSDLWNIYIYNMFVHPFWVRPAAISDDWRKKGRDRGKIYMYICYHNPLKYLPAY